MSGVASVASVSAIAPSIAAPIGGAGDSSDPFIAALQAWKVALVEYEAAIQAAGKIEDALDNPDIARDHTRVQFGTHVVEDDEGRQSIKPRYLFSHEEIDRACDKIRPRYEGDAEAIASLEAERGELHAAFDADAAWLDCEQECCGFKAAREKVDAAGAREHALLCEACYIVPTTLAGLLAFARFLSDEIFFSEKGEPIGANGTLPARQSLVTLEQALANFAEPVDSAVRSRAHDDVTLLRLERKLGEKIAAVSAAREAEDRAIATFKAQKPRRPRSASAIAAWCKACDELKERERLELGRLGDAHEAALDALDSIWGEIAVIRATSIAGLRVKARLAQFHLEQAGDPEWDAECYDVGRVGLNLIKDVLAAPARA
jgi:hypothetical protein